MRSASSAGKMNILLCGYYGFHNAGDDATLHAVMDSIRSAAPQAELTVLSGSPEETACLYRCRAAARFSLPAVCRALRACDALVFGGGSLLQDVTSTRSLLYYLLLLRAARLLGKKTMLFGNGIGPVLTAANRRRVAAAVRKIDCVTLRDEDSLHELEKMGVDRQDLMVTADPVFAYRFQNADASLLSEAAVPEDMPFVAVSVRSWTGMDAFSVQAAAAFDEICRSSGRSIVFLPMHPEYDRQTSEKIAQRMECRAYVLPDGSADQLMAVIGRADMVVSMRLHALVFAARMGVPAAGIVYDPKTASFLKQMGMPSCVDVAGFTAEKAAAVMRTVLDSREDCSREIRGRSAVLERKAEENARAFMHMMSGQKEKQ